MIDAQASEPIQIEVGGKAHPYLRVSVDQIPRIRSLFDRQGIEYWVETNAISIDGRSPTAFVVLGRGNDLRKVQAILDRAH